MTTALDPTVVAELTPPGRAAVAVVVVAGPKSLKAVSQFFVPSTPWGDGEPPLGRIMLGRWGGEQGEELVVCRRGEDEFEIHCHGGAAAATAIVEQLVDVGCQRLSWREWLAFCQRRMHLLEESESRRDSATCSRVSPRRGPKPATSVPPHDSPTCESIIALAEATTARTAGVLLDQYRGALSSEVVAARAALATSDALQAREIIDGLLKLRDLGLHLTTPWRVVIAGPPNVGKSSLLNAIAGYERAIVSPLLGTTRDVVTIVTAINGWPVQIADTAGLRETCDELESAGVTLARATLEQANLVIVVSDATAECDDAKEILDRMAPTARVIRAVNKIDLVDGGEDALARRASRSARAPMKFISALTGQGIAELLAAIDGLLVPLAPPAGAAVPFTAAQIGRLETARAAIDGGDLAAADAALAALLAGPPRFDGS